MDFVDLLLKICKYLVLSNIHMFRIKHILNVSLNTYQKKKKACVYIYIYVYIYLFTTAYKCTDASLAILLSECPPSSN